MGLKVSDVRRAERTTTLKFPEGDLVVTYRPNVYTPALVAEMGALAEADEDDSSAMAAQNRGFLAMMTELLVSWDLIDDDGEIVAIESDALENVPFPIFQAITTHIGKENSPGEARKR